MQGEGKNLKPIRYGPFEILEKIGTNAFRLNLPPYMQIYSVVNVENLKLYEPPMIFDEDANIQVPSVDDLAPKYMSELPEDVILDRNVRSSKRGAIEYFKVGCKGMHPGKAQCMEVERVRELYPHLLFKYNFISTSGLVKCIGSVTSFLVVSLAATVLVGLVAKETPLETCGGQVLSTTSAIHSFYSGRETLRLFSAKEMARAYNNYSNEMVLESGGFETVFKGILLDGTLVAIKKSKQAFNVEDGHDFLNEVTILSQINHRNIASRLQIAIETTEALAYLHSEASQPIFHRDVKSTNILLNESFSPKVVDFGISRLISTSNDTHLTTNIMDTTGYLDPKCFQTYQLTDKSNVYSFSVLLIERITGLEPLSVERISDEWSLSNLFLSRIKNNRLREISDSKVLEEENLQQMQDMGRLARECPHLERRKQPLMKEVVEEHLWIRGGAR
ncbi:wall-associated receptor kinase-like 22 [Cryptomeria japonica]|uniref:wall-associated receptor kinase-like 22 n=1 Tax=Cryptomeria japonica TaxID=3369 RepID=UPI0027DA9727|nr:wall-associated receptor kinase-like 22 [Cryptomeria japonica]